mgnify:CR=1 FL=1
MVLHVDRNGNEVRTTYNVDGNGETLAAYAHTPGERLKEIRHGNGIRTGYEYDTDGNLVHLHMEHTDGEILADLYYSHDLNGNRTLKSGSRIGGEGKATEHTMSLTLAKSEGNRNRLTRLYPKWIHSHRKI